MDNQSNINPNSLALIALCNEYCAAIENCMGSEPSEFTALMLRLLPRIYIAATDLDADSAEGAQLEPSLNESHYDEVRSNIAAILGADDTYLEVFEEDMKYSDTPIAATVSESLADLFQEFYNFIEGAKDAPAYLVQEMLAALKEDFTTFWSTTLCNVLRPLNNIRYSSTDNQYQDYEY